MCNSPDIKPPPPPPAPPPVLEQVAPKSASSSDSRNKKRTGLSRYKIQPTEARSKTLGGISTKTGAGM